MLRRPISEDGDHDGARLEHGARHPVLQGNSGRLVVVRNSANGAARPLKASQSGSSLSPGTSMDLALLARPLLVRGGAEGTSRVVERQGAGVSSSSTSTMMLPNLLAVVRC
jgi:hypothetical protein